MIVLKVIAALSNVGAMIALVWFESVSDFLAFSFVFWVPCFFIGLLDADKMPSWLETIAILLYLVVPVDFLIRSGLPRLFDGRNIFFAHWSIVLCVVCNVILILSINFIGRIKALTKGNPHILAAYVFAVILIVLLTILVIKL